MSLLDQVRHTLGEAAANARDAGQNLGAQASAQLAIKRLQLETAKKTRDLGARVYEWHQSGTLVATGTVPRDVSDLCHTLDDLHGQLKTEEEKLEAAKQEAEEAKRRILEAREARNASSVTVYDVPAVATSAPDSPVVPAAPSAVAAPVAPPVQTQILSGEDMPTPPLAATTAAPQITALGTSGPAMPGLPSVPAPGSNPDMPSPGIPVPGPDIPAGPSIPTSNPDVNPTPAAPGSPGVTSPEPTMPGQPV